MLDYALTHTKITNIINIWKLDKKKKKQKTKTRILVARNP